MTAAWFASLMVFCVVMSFTPGPNNVMATSSGLSHGVRRTLPFIFGVLIGCAALLAAAGLGVAALLLADPRIGLVMRITGAGYMLYLAWELWTSAGLQGAEAGPPFRLWHGALLQLVNPKAWMMAVTAVATFVAGSLGSAFRFAIVVSMIEIFSLLSMLFWAGGGAGLRSALRSPMRVRLFNRSMALLAAATGAMMLALD